MTEHYSLDEQMREAIRDQMDHARASLAINRADWTREQWIADARKQMGDLHGSVRALVNGHVMALFEETDRLNRVVGETVTKIDRARKHHSPINRGRIEPCCAGCEAEHGHADGYCAEWPCTTRRLLDGEPTHE